jgi:hypothetical protein
MHPGDRLGLLADLRRPAAIVEQHEHHCDIVLGGDGQKLLHPLDESLGINFVDDVLHEDPHAIHAGFFGPAQLLVDGLGIEGFFLPHFGAVDGAAGQVVAAADRSDTGIPLPCLLGRPAGVAELLQLRGVGGRTTAGAKRKNGQANSQRKGFHNDHSYAHGSHLTSSFGVGFVEDCNLQRRGLLPCPDVPPCP